MTWDLSTGAARVWDLITNPAKLQLWAPFTADRDLSQVGRAVLFMLDETGEQIAKLPAVVLVADAPRVLEHSWGSDVVAWRLGPVGSGCRLTLHQTLADEKLASANAAGWHLCMEVASAVLDGIETPPVRGQSAEDHGWHELNAAYAEALGVSATRFA